MIFRRVAPIEKRLDWKTPCWSGPRWMSVAFDSRMRPGGAVQFLVVKPVIPHNSAHPASVPEWNLRFLLHSHEPSQDTISVLALLRAAWVAFAFIEDLAGESATKRLLHSKKFAHRCRRGERQKAAG